MANIRELQELVMVREEELRYATWRLDDARRRLQLAEAEQWATEIEKDLEAKAALQPAPKPPPPKAPLNSPPQEDTRMQEQEVKEEPAEPTSPAVEDETEQVLPVPTGGKKNKLTANVDLLVQSAMRAAAKQQECTADQTEKTSSAPSTATSNASANPGTCSVLTPPPPPPPESVRTMCPVACACGEACTRVERMLRQQASTPFARTRLKHSNHTCDTCQEAFIQRKRTYGVYGRHR